MQFSQPPTNSPSPLKERQMPTALEQWTMQSFYLLDWINKGFGLIN